MSLTAAVPLTGLVMLVLVSPWLAARLFEGRAPARTVAVFHLLALGGFAALPVVALGCVLVVSAGGLAGAAGAWADVGGASWGALWDGAVARLAGVALLVAYVSRFAWVAARAARVTARLAAGLTAQAPLVNAGQLPSPGGPRGGWVLETRQPLAYAVGGPAGGVVVSRGLLALLDLREREAVLAHEFAHLRLRHHRLLVFAHVVAATVGEVMPAADHARQSLARELEVIADQAAVGAVGDRRVVARALAKAALANAAPAAAPGFGGETDLAYRLDRLAADRPGDDRRVLATAATGLLLAGLVTIAAVGFHLDGPVPGGTGALAAAGAWWLTHRGVAAPDRP